MKQTNPENWTTDSKTAYVTDKLKSFGLSRQEATLYLCLYENGELSGYEASKLTGISRSNVYAALNTLTDKGAAYVCEGSVMKYGAVDAEEYLSNYLRRLSGDKEYILGNLPKPPVSEEGYLTIYGHKNIRDKIYNMISGCRMRLYFAAEWERVEEFRDVLTESVDRGIKVVIISDRDFSAISSKSYLASQEKGQLRLITDSSFVLTGELTDRDTDTCLYSGKEALVVIMKEALRNKIKLIEMESEEKIND